MSAPINTGGPAFPGTEGVSGYGHSAHVTLPDGSAGWANFSQGMTLRDWFAGQALAGLMVNYDQHPNDMATCAGMAVDASNAMIAAREAKP